MPLIKQNYKTMSQLPRQAARCESGCQPGFELIAWLQPRRSGGAGESGGRDKRERRGCARGACPIPTRDAARPRGSVSLQSGSFALGAASWPSPRAEGSINTALRCNGAAEVLDTLQEDVI